MTTDSPLRSIFVAGASGVLGREFLRRALASGHRVSGTNRSERSAQIISDLGAAPMPADAFDRDQVAHAIAESGADTVVNLLTDLSTGDSGSNAQLRTLGTQHLTDAAHAAGITRFVTASISWVFPADTALATEDTPLDLSAPEPRLTTIRGVQSLETGARSFDGGIVLRFGQLYGPGTWFARDGRFAEDARAGRLPATETVASFLHRDDAVSALVLALGWPAGTWNIVDDEPAPGREWVPVFARAVGAEPPELLQSEDIGRPVSNHRAREHGLVLQHPSWRTGFFR